MSSSDIWCFFDTWCNLGFYTLGVIVALFLISLGATIAVFSKSKKASLFGVVALISLTRIFYDLGIVFGYW